MSKFVTYVSCLVLKKCRTAMLNRDIDLERLMMYAQYIEADKIRDSDKVRGNKRTKSEKHRYSPTRSHGGNHRQFQSHSSMPEPSSASSPVPRGM